MAPHETAQNESATSIRQRLNPC